jgi:hypothetical protein
MPQVPFGWYEFKNNAAGTVPARGIIRITGTTVVDAGRVVLQGAKPNTYGDVGTMFINGPVDVATGKYGICTRIGQAGLVTAVYDSGTGTPAYGQTWGPIDSSFKMSRISQGWFCEGVATNAGQSLALFRELPMRSFRGKMTSTLSARSCGSPVAAYYYRSDANTYTDSGYTTLSNCVFNGLDASVASGSWCEFVYDPFMNGATPTDGWRITQADFTCS